MKRKPSITTNCVANRYAKANERIVEFSGDHGAGCLVSVTKDDNGQLTVQVYRREACDVLVSPV